MGGTGRGTLGPLALSEAKRSTFIKTPLRFPSPIQLTPAPHLHKRGGRGILWA